jgi:hypothetical protein
MPPGTRDNANFVNDYLADFNDDDDPFRSPSPEPPKKTGNNEKEKRKDVLGIETQLDLKRKPRAPRVKLDESRFVTYIWYFGANRMANFYVLGCSQRRESLSCARWRRSSSSRAKGTR